MGSIGAESAAPAPLRELERAATALAVAAVPTSPQLAMTQVDRLLRVVDVLELAIDERVAVIDGSGAARAAGHASTSAWLRSGGDPAGSARMGASAASRHRRDSRQFARLDAVADAIRHGRISHPMGSAIAGATAVLEDDRQARLVERILLQLAEDPSATVEKVVRAGKYLRQVLDPGGHLAEHQHAYHRRYLTAHADEDGGLAGSYYLPPEPAAKLQALLDRYARPARAEDTRTQAQRNADTLIQLLTSSVSTELLVLVNAETLPDDHDHEAAPTEPAHVAEPTGPHARPAEPYAGPSGHQPEPAEPTAGLTQPQSEQAGPAGPEPEPAEPPDDGRAERSSPGPATNPDVPGLLLPTGHPLPAPDVRRLALTSTLYRAVVRAPSKILDLGDAVRVAPRWMRRALLATYDTCAYDRCPVPAKWCEIDHVHPWAGHRRTRLDDLAPGCDHHNRDRARHPERYRIQRRADGRWHITTRRRYRL